MILTILHISDLHRDPQNQTTNTALLNSLLRDRDRYTTEDPQIKSPDLVVISGDIVQGVESDRSDSLAEVQRQYDDAYDLLSRLAEDLLDGNKEKVIVVPGNHDVFSPYFLKSVKALNVDRNAPGVRKLVQQIFSPMAPFRWSWKMLDVFEIVDEKKYLRRLEPFCDFYARFYEGRRSMDINPEEQYDIFDYPEYNVTFAAFSSCFNNDLFNREGQIHPVCLANAGKDVNHWQYNDRIRLAVWHHNTSGAPAQSGYMDADTLQILIDNGFSVGFHGHQHRSQFIDERFKAGTKRKITVIGASTLCGGPSMLPSGQRRSYNIFELDTGSLSGTLHIREMQNNSFMSPVWGPCTFPSSLSSLLKVEVQAPPAPLSAGTGDTHLLAEAEAKLRARQYDEAIGLLLPLVGRNELARRLLLECLGKKDDKDSNELTIKHFDRPSSTTEIVYLFDALWTEQKHERLRELLASAQVAESSDPTVIDIRRKYLARLDS